MLATIRKVADAKNAADREEGASAVEYGLLIAAIAAVIIGLVFAVGFFVKAGFQDTCDSLSKNSTATHDCK